MTISQEHLSEIRKLLPPGTMVYTVLNHVSRSGMMRAIDVRCITEDSGLTGIPYMEELGFKYNKKHGTPKHHKNGGYALRHRWI